MINLPTLPKTSTKAIYLSLQKIQCCALGILGSIKKDHDGNFDVAVYLNKCHLLLCLIVIGNLVVTVFNVNDSFTVNFNRTWGQHGATFNTN